MVRTALVRFPVPDAGLAWLRWISLQRLISMDIFLQQWKCFLVTGSFAWNGQLFPSKRQRAWHTLFLDPSRKLLLNPSCTITSFPFLFPPSCWASVTSPVSVIHPSGQVIPPCCYYVRGRQRRRILHEQSSLLNWVVDSEDAAPLSVLFSMVA